MSTLTVKRNQHQDLHELKKLSLPYYRDMLADRDERNKYEQRAMVKDFFLAHRPDVIERLLTLPGGAWAFERDYLCTSTSARFIGVERNQSVFNASLLHMPGYLRTDCQIECYRDNGQTYTGRLYGVESEDAILIHCNLSVFLQDIQPRRNSPCRKYAQLYKNLTGAWIDFSGPLCPEVTASLTSLSLFSMHGGVDTFPIVVSYMAAREPRGFYRVLKSEQILRSEFIMELLNHNPGFTFQKVGAFAYLSHERTPMETVFTLGRRKRKGGLNWKPTA